MGTFVRSISVPIAIKVLMWALLQLLRFRIRQFHRSHNLRPQGAHRPQQKTQDRDVICKFHYSSFVWAKDEVNSGSLLRIHQSAGFVGRIGHRTDVRDQRSDVSLGKRVSPRRHLRRFVQSGTAVTDDGNQVSIAHFVERVAFGERMRFDRKIVHVRDALRRGLRVVAADAILRVELSPYRLLVAQRDLVNGQVDALSRRVCACWQ